MRSHILRGLTIWYARDVPVESLMRPIQPALGVKLTIIHLGKYIV